ncbi:3,4-dihydroxy-2-butanone-4-phosphate synthase [Virgibacillus dokdonensis]|uniref:3,4-dihydroxy-2-butanone 4-phosphate synthase n=1 Tax=Virgibacillus dokdonensis TaxID=302167 RepID=A0A3E0WVL5_9BACI|nr:3,4-dihydroxy-2-butanone-4-phosphate synthase [Virgibacillus dokdonensis]
MDMIVKAIDDLKAGKPVIVIDDENRENEGDFVAISEYITPATINFMITHGKGLVCAAVDREIAKRLGLALMPTTHTDPFATAFTVSIDHKDTSTGISAFDRATTIRALANPFSGKDDFHQPGHVFPLIAQDGGVLVRQGHTEAAVDLAKLCGATPSGTICEIIHSDGSMARLNDLKKMAKQFNIRIISVQQLITYKITEHEECGVIE